MRVGRKQAECDSIGGVGLCGIRERLGALAGVVDHVGRNVVAAERDVGMPQRAQQSYGHGHRTGVVDADGSVEITRFRRNVDAHGRQVYGLELVAHGGHELK